MYFINSNEQVQATIPLGVSIERLRNKRNRILDVISNSLYKTKVDSDTRKLFNILSPLIQALSTPTHTAVGEIECLEKSMIQVSAVLSKNIRKLSRTSLGKSLISQIITTMSENVINYGYPTNQTNHRRSFELHGDNIQHLMHSDTLAANKNAPLLVQSGTVIEVKREKENLTSGSRRDTFSKNDIKTENQNIEEDEDDGDDDDDDVTELPNTNDSEFVLIEDYESEDDSSSTSSSASSSSSLAAECNDDNNEADNSVDEVFIENCYKNSSDNTPKSSELEFGNPNYVCHENNIFC